MNAPVVFLADEMKRVGFRFHPSVVRATIPDSVVGVYCLLHKGTAIYVGRSDRCLVNRLVQHPLGRLATHFIWEPSRGQWSGFCLESYWWHRMSEFPNLQNQTHPARPKGASRSCPFCERRDLEAFARLLPWIGASSMSEAA